MNDIILKNFCLGGIAESESIGNAFSVAEMTGFNLHKNPGLLVSSKQMVETDNEVDGGVITVNVSNNTVVHFSKFSGKIWTNSDASPRYTTVPSTGAAKCLDAKEYNGYLYWATVRTVQRIAITSLTSWSGAVEELSTTLHTVATGGEAYYHPMEIINNLLYIGDGKFLMQIDTDNAVIEDVLNGNIIEPFRIKCLRLDNTNLLIGLYGGGDNYFLPYTYILRWNTYEESFSYSDQIPESSVDCIIPLDNTVLIVARGRVYSYDEYVATILRPFPGEIVEGYCYVLPNAICSQAGKAFFGITNASQTANSVKAGIYTFARSSASLPYVLTLEHPIKNGATDIMQDVIIHGLSADSYGIHVSWEKVTTQEAHISTISNDDKQNSGSVFKTKKYYFDSDSPALGKVIVGYSTLPVNSTIKIEVSKNNGAFAEMTGLIDTINSVYISQADVGACRVFQARITTTTGNGTLSPELDLFNVTA